MVRFKKIYRDLLINKSRAILVVLAIGLGIFGLGTVLNSNYILVREMDKNYMDTNPASFVLRVENADDNLIGLMESTPEVNSIELRKTVVGRIFMDENEWGTILLFAINDFDSVSVDIFTYEEGEKYPSVDEILIERAAFGVANTQIGETVEIKIPDHDSLELKVSGSVHAPGLPPAHMEHYSYGFISKSTLEELGDKSALDEVRIVVSGDIYDIEHIERVSENVYEIVSDHGYIVRSLEIPTPGKHPHGDEMSGFIFILQLFSGLSLVMSGVLVVNMISNLLAGQMHQIGIMKITGATARQLIIIYYAMVSFLGLFALLIAMPMSVLFARLCVHFSAMELNFTINDYSIPWNAFAIQLMVGIIVPLIAATIPVIKACKASVKNLIVDYGIKQESFSIIRSTKKTKTSVSLKISIRNLFRKKIRVLLTLGTLVIGGLLFVLSLNIYTSFNHTVDEFFEFIQYDVEIRFSQLYAEEDLVSAFHGIDNIESVEYMNYSMVSMKQTDSSSSKQYPIKAVPIDSALICLPLLEGQWYEEGDTNNIVINQSLAMQESELTIGDLVTLNIQGKDIEFTILGIADEAASKPTIYIERKGYIDLVDNDEKINYILIKTEYKDFDTQRSVLTALEEKAELSELNIIEAWMTYQYKKSFLDHLNIVLVFLIFAAVLTVVVGGIGLASTMGISVLERIREIGVMRSIGASNNQITQILLTEGLIVGLISWIIVSVLSIPLAYSAGHLVGSVVLNMDLSTAFSVISYIVWLILIVIITLISSVISARRALSIPINEIIAYE